MRTSLIVGLVLLSSFAFADRLILTPTGNKIRQDEIRFQSIFEGNKSNSRVLFVGAGLGESFDLELGEERVRTDLSQFRVDFSYNYAVAFPDISPGVSVGVQDALDETQQGLGVYLAITWKYNNFDPWNDQTPIEFTLGAGVGRFKGAFVSTRLPLSNTVRVVAEHDSQLMTAGIELVPAKNIRLLVAVRGQQTLTGAQASFRF